MPARIYIYIYGEIRIFPDPVWAPLVPTNLSRVGSSFLSSSIELPAYSRALHSFSSLLKFCELQFCFLQASVVSSRICRLKLSRGQRTRLSLERSEGLLRACTGNCPWSFVILLFQENIRQIPIQQSCFWIGIPTKNAITRLSLIHFFGDEMST